MHHTGHPFYHQLQAQVTELGGLFNAHLHLDRAGTLEPRYMATKNYKIMENSFVSLHEKHSLIHVIHAGEAYQEEDLRQRVTQYVQRMVDCQTRRADTMVDVTADNIGLGALFVLKEVQEAFKDRIDLRIAAYSPFGFRDDHPEWWSVFYDGVKQADFIGCLPEADDTIEYPEHIGFSAHCERMLLLAQAENKMLHVHTDQRNEPAECGTERLIEAVQRVGAPKSPDGLPMVWAVHAISPSTYSETRFQRMVDGLLDNNIGIICCPSAAIGMRQLRPLATPTYNCIPRVLELLAAGVPVRIASDNIADICSPSTTENLLDEIFILSAALRFYDVNILAKLAAGSSLNESDRDFIRYHLKQNDLEIAKVLSRYHTDYKYV